MPLLVRLGTKYRLDPRALRAVALGEGGLVNRQGDIGDVAGGGSYGPFQLYAQGALPAGLRGNPQAADQWAWSPQGINYALRKMVEAGAGGLAGAEAVRTIISKFERPADPQGSIQRALARLGQGGALPSGGIPQSRPISAGAYLGSPAVAPQGDARSVLMAGLASGQKLRTLLPAMMAAASSGVETMGTRISPRTASTPLAAPVTAQGQPSRFGAPVELFHDPLGGIKHGQQIGAIGGHGQHVHYAAPNPQQMLRAISLAQRLGLAVRPIEGGDFDIVGLPCLAATPNQIFTPNVFTWTVVGEDYQWVPRFGRGLEQVEAVGSACIAIHRKVLKKIKAPFNEELHPNGTVKLSGDLRFCEKAASQGFKIGCDFDALCEHYRTVHLSSTALAYSTALLESKDV